MNNAPILTSKVETISPQAAENYLKFNQHNRVVRWAHVESLKQDILAGKWILTHQGIAFGSDGFLMDGQHRLLAIQASGKPVQIMVTRGLAPCPNGSNSDIYAMDVIDSGKRRSAADQLNLVHGVANANLTVGAIRCIISICSPDKGKLQITTTRAIPIISIMGGAIERMITLATNTKTGRKAGVVGTLAFAYGIDKTTIEEFMGNLCGGDGINKTDPVYHLREHIISKGVGGGSGSTQDRFREMVAIAVSSTMRGAPMKQLKSGDSGLDYLRSKQRGLVEKVRAVMGYNK